MIKSINGFYSALLIIILTFFFVLWPYCLKLNALTFKQNDELIERIAKDFSKKFCNGIGFGLSEESAVNFAIKENMATFKKKKGIESIDNKAIVEKVSNSVFDRCAYPLTLSEDQWG
tara:strand:- start:6332 stop:6682 length:351 start_codon:yes stop_codon:yes gene_type:complete